MPKLTRNTVILFKIQPTAGVDAAPVAGTDAILAKNISMTPVNAEFAERNLIKPYFGNTGKIQVQAYANFEFSVELSGAGAAGSAAKYGTLLRTCAHAQTLIALTKADYSLVTSAQEAGTCHIFLDGMKFAMTDCKGTVSYTLNAKGIPEAKFNMTGFVATITDTANPSGVTYAGFTDPVAVNKQNTLTFTIHGVAVKATSLSIDIGNQVDYRNYIGSEAVTLTNRDVKGSATFELDTIANKDWFASVRAGTLGTFSFIHGTGAGNIIEFSAPKVQVVSPDFSDDNGLQFLTLGLEFQPNLGNDELLLSVR
jgi:hypothetical protein